MSRQFGASTGLKLPKIRYLYYQPNLSQMKTLSYYLLITGTLFLASCHKNDTPAKSNSGGSDTTNTQKEYLVKINEPSLSDSIIFLYANDTVLRCIANEYQYNSAPTIEAFYPVLSSGHWQGINASADTTGNNTSPLYTFILDGSGRVLESEAFNYFTGTFASYDSLVYSNGYISTVYNFAGQPGIGILNTVSSLTWDANGDVTQILVGDSLTGLSTNYSYNYTFTYDTKVNPYILINAAFPMAILNADSWQYMSTHNVLTIQTIEQQSPTQITSATTNTYTYDTAGNPLTLSSVYAENGSSDTTLQVFHYTLK
jgi:hypothetical protein